MQNVDSRLLSNLVREGTLFNMKYAGMCMFCNEYTRVHTSHAEDTFMPRVLKFHAKQPSKWLRQEKCYVDCL